MSRTLLLSLLVLSSLAALASAQDPVIYITFHGGSSGINTIYSYDLTGQSLQTDVLQGDSNADGLRSGVILQDGTLLVCNSHDTSSRLVQYSTCDENSNRQYLADFATSNLAHPYGLATGLDEATGADAVWATNQDTYDLVQFSSHGAFQEQVKQFGSEELRSVAYDDSTGVLYVANENEDAVLAYNTKTSEFDTALNYENITDPIGLYIDATNRYIFIGSNSSPSAVYLYDLDSKELLQTFQDSNLQHPAGMVAYNDGLYVISQTVGSLMLFNVTTGALVDTIIDSFPDTPEQIMFSPC